MFVAGISKASPITGHWLLQLRFLEYFHEKYHHIRKHYQNTMKFEENHRKFMGLLRLQNADLRTASNSFMLDTSFYLFFWG